MTIGWPWPREGAKRQRVTVALMMSRRDSLNRGLSWDVADVMAVLEEEGLL